MSGNLSFLNWLTIVPSLACFDDASLGFLFHSGGGAKKAVLEIQNEEAAGRKPKPTKGTRGSKFEESKNNSQSISALGGKCPMLFFFFF